MKRSPHVLCTCEGRVRVRVRARVILACYMVDHMGHLEVVLVLALVDVLLPEDERGGGEVDRAPGLALPCRGLGGEIVEHPLPHLVRVRALRA